jgi:hypothetical protein
MPRKCEVEILTGLFLELLRGKMGKYKPIDTHRSGTDFQNNYKSTGSIQDILPVTISKEIIKIRSRQHEHTSQCDGPAWLTRERGRCEFLVSISLSLPTKSR